MKAHPTPRKILLLENIHQNAVHAFKQAGWSVITHPKAMSEDELIKALQGVTALGIRSKTKVTEKVLQAHPQLSVIGAFCIGTNQIDCKAATSRGVVVFNAPYSNTRSVVELTIAEVIMLMRKVFDASTSVHAGGWLKSSSGCFEVRGKKLGIIGYGNIGSQLSVIAENLGMHVAFFDAAEKLALGNARRMKTLTELLKWADVISIHVDGREENRNLIGEKEIHTLREGSYVINNARGHVVDIEALARALRKGYIAGAAVDVFPKEPKGNDERFMSALQRLPNVILTPHIGGSTEEAQESIGEYVSGKLLQFFATGDTMLSVNFPHAAPNGIPSKAFRFSHIHQNTSGMLAAINDILASRKINVVSQYLKTNETIGYVVTDCSGKLPKDLFEALSSVPHTVRVNIVQ